MASGGKIEITDGHKCPVCLGGYDQPRVLPCNHMFCKQCLEQWLNKNKLECPVCRQETVFKDKFGVQKLPEPMIIKDETEKVTKLLSMGCDMGIQTRSCGMCSRQDSSNYFCEVCHKNLCDECKKKHKLHKRYSLHKIITISKLTHCNKHQDEPITYYCCDCFQGLCTLCADTGHLDDQVIEIRDPELVQGKKDKLKRFTRSLPHGVTTLTNHKVQVHKFIRSLADSYDKCEQGLISVRAEVVEQIDKQLVTVRQNKSAELKRLALYEEEIENMIATRNSLATFIKGLQDTAAETVLSADKLPVISSNTVPVMPTYKVPAIENKVKKLIECAKALISSTSRGGVTGQNTRTGTVDIDVNVQHLTGIPSYESIQGSHKTTAKTAKYNISRSNISSVIRSSDLVTSVPTFRYIFKSDVKVGHSVSDITYDRKEQSYWIRTMKPELLKLNLGGEINTRMMNHIPQCSSGIEFDSENDQLILVDQKQGLVILSRRGDLVNNVKICGGGGFSGVTYCPNRDVFVVTDISNHCLWFLSSQSGKVLQKLGTVGSGDKQFICQRFICHQSVGEAECNIVVSDDLNHCIKLFTCTGEFIRKFGTRGNGDGQLQRPRGVCVDPWGRIIVSDQSRVVCFWWDGAERFEVLLNKEQLDGKRPNCVSVSADGVQLLVGMSGGDGIIKIFNI